jgi:hypothetical protein
MTSQRSQAYGRVMRTLADLGPAKLLGDEHERLREAADTLLFCEDLHDEAAATAVRDVRAVVDHLVATQRWSAERADRLADDIAACGPLALVG